MGAGRSNTSRELERLTRKSIKAGESYGIAVLVAVPIVPIGAMAAFGSSGGQAYWFYWSLAIFAAVALYAVWQRRKTDRLIGELHEAGYFEHRYRRH